MNGRPSTDIKKPRNKRGLVMLGGSGETRTRDQRIKRSRSSSFPYIDISLSGDQNQCAIDCAIAFWCKVRI